MDHSFNIDFMTDQSNTANIALSRALYAQRVPPKAFYLFIYGWGKT